MEDKIDNRSIIRGMKGCCQNELIAKGTLEVCSHHSLFDFLVIKTIGGKGMKAYYCWKRGLNSAGILDLF